MKVREDEKNMKRFSWDPDGIQIEQIGESEDAVLKAITFDELIAKYNPYHDGRGRFASADGAASFSLGGTHSQRGKAKEKESARTAAARAADEAEKPKDKPKEESKERRFREYSGDQDAIKDELNKEREKQWSSLKMTEAEEIAIDSYTGVNYKWINGYLRGTERHPPKIAIEDAEALTKLLSRSSLKEDTLLMRGMREETVEKLFGGKDPATLRKQIVGKTITDKAFVSTTVDHGSVSTFGEIQFHVKAKAGARALIINGKSKHPGENEVLLPPNASMKVTNVKSIWESPGWGRPKVKRTVIEAEYE